MEWNVDNVSLENVSIVLRLYHAGTCYYYCKHFTFFWNNVSFLLDFSAIL